MKITGHSTDGYPMIVILAQTVSEGDQLKKHGEAAAKKMPGKPRYEIDSHGAVRITYTYQSLRKAFWLGSKEPEALRRRAGQRFLKELRKLM